MNRERVIELAREAGISIGQSVFLPAPNGQVEALADFAALIEAEVLRFQAYYQVPTLELDSDAFAVWFDQFGEQAAQKHPMGIVRELAKMVLALRKEREVREDAEPVAYEVGNDIYWHDGPDTNDWIRENGIPLYRHPQPAVVAQEPVVCERCEELGYDKATYFRLYEQACIELQKIKTQTPSAEIKVSHFEIEGERVEVVSCDLSVGVHHLYAHPVANVASQKPIAWMHPDEDIGRTGFTRFSREPHKEWNIPVYTHPAPAVVAQLIDADEHLMDWAKQVKYDDLTLADECVLLEMKAALSAVKDKK